MCEVLSDAATRAPFFINPSSSILVNNAKYQCLVDKNQGKWICILATLKKCQDSQEKLRAETKKTFSAKEQEILKLYDTFVDLVLECFPNSKKQSVKNEHISLDGTYKRIEGEKFLTLLDNGSAVNVLKTGIVNFHEKQTCTHINLLIEVQ